MAERSDLLTTREAAQLARVSVRTWRRYQQLGTGPPVAGYVGRSPRWRRADVLAWIEQDRPRQH
jgi:predicted DNA-binding transcriptional regulator AlpA